jgi:hypothetical protein
MEPTKLASVPSIGFSAGAAVIAYYYLPALAANGIEPATGVAAITAVITPFANVGGALLGRLTARIKGETANA